MNTKEWVCHIHRSLNDPEDRSVLLFCLRLFLWPFAMIYGGATWLRNVFYDWGLKKSEKADVPVVSVGNITVGGTGKTPFVAWLCERLMEKDIQPAVLSRGYGANSSAGVDDENEMLASLIPEVPVVVNPDRVEGARMAVGKHAADVLVMDDGFQHRRLERDCDIVLLDSLDPFGGGYTLPLGSLREPVCGLSRADVVVLTRADQVGAESIGKSRDVLREHAGKVPMAMAEHRPVDLCEVGDRRRENMTVERVIEHDGRWGAFCGIGNPQAFSATLEEMGVEVAFFRAFPDHHVYTGQTLAELQEQATATGCRGLLTTEKDAVKVGRLVGPDDAVPVWALRVRMTITDGETELWSVVQKCVKGA